MGVKAIGLILLVTTYAFASITTCNLQNNAGNNLQECQSTLDLVISNNTLVGNLTGSVLGSLNLTAQDSLTATLGGTATIASAGVIFANPYLIIAPTALVLIGFMPSGALFVNSFGLPYPYNAWMMIVFILLFLVAITNFYTKGENA